MKSLTMPWSLYEAMNRRCRDEYDRRMMELDFRPKKQCDRTSPHRCLHPWHAELNRVWYRERQRIRNLEFGHARTPSLYVENRRRGTPLPGAERAARYRWRGTPIWKDDRRRAA